jgi:hypothetical protein
MGVIAVHHPTAVATREYISHGVLLDDLQRAGHDPGEWIILLTRIPNGSYGHADPIGEDDRQPPYAWLRPPPWVRRRAATRQLDKHAGRSSY